jgi:hypothetical protein
LVLQSTALRVAAIAPRTRSPTRAPWRAIQARVTSALSSKSPTVMPCPAEKSCTLPAFGALSSSRQAL